MYRFAIVFVSKRNNSNEAGFYSNMHLATKQEVCLGYDFIF